MHFFLKMFGYLHFLSYLCNALRPSAGLSGVQQEGRNSYLLLVLFFSSKLNFIKLWHVLLLPTSV